MDDSTRVWPEDIAKLLSNDISCAAKYAESKEKSETALLIPTKVLSYEIVQLRIWYGWAPVEAPWPDEAC